MAKENFIRHLDVNKQSKTKSHNQIDHHETPKPTHNSHNYNHHYGNPKKFTESTLRDACGHFEDSAKDNHLVGEGGFGDVWKGILKSTKIVDYQTNKVAEIETEIAVKRAYITYTDKCSRRKKRIVLSKSLIDEGIITEKEWKDRYDLFLKEVQTMFSIYKHDNITPLLGIAVKSPWRKSLSQRVEWNGW